MSLRRGALMCGAILASSVVALVACTGGHSHDGHGQAPDSEQVRAFERCMDEAGYRWAEVGPPPTVVAKDSIWEIPEFQLAYEGCVVASGVGEVVGDTPEDVEQLNKQARDYTGCVRERGWVIADPVPERHGRFMIPGRVTVPDDPAARAALVEDTRACGLETQPDL